MTTIVSTNDFHSSLSDGRATLSAIQSWREQGAVIVDAGDFFGGCAFHEFSQGQAEHRLMALLYDYRVPGNHDLRDFGKIPEDARYPTVLCANMRPRLPFPGRWIGSALVTAAPPVGLVGFLGRQAFESADADDQALFEFSEPTPELLRSHSDRLRSAGAEYLVGVSHSGFRRDVELQERENLFDLILSGHCHSGDFLWVSPKSTAHVAKAPELGAGYLRADLLPGGQIIITFDRPARGEGEGLPPFVAEALGEFAAWARMPLCRLERSMPDREEVARWLASSASMHLHGTVLFNLGAFRRGLPELVDQGAIANALPFDSPIVRCHGAWPVATIAEAAAAKGERPIVHLTDEFGRNGYIYTTRYLAKALDLSISAEVGDLTLRSLVAVSAGRSDASSSGDK
jgi:hypothetical protein